MALDLHSHVHVELGTIIVLVAGLALLVVGGEILVGGASRLAAVLGVSPLVIGLTVVAFGTSSPELAVNIFAGLSGAPSLAAGNVVGSNIFNTLLILGVCALITPLVVARQVVRLELPIVIGASLLVWGLAADGRLGAIDGVLLAGLLVAYLAWSVIRSRRETAARDEFVREFGEERLAPRKGALVVARDIGFILAGLAALVLGSRWLVQSATAIARSLGVDDLVIGLTLVAAGTSLPELATSIIATARRERDIAVGNVVGSNIFNLLGILGLSAVVTPGGVLVSDALLGCDLAVMTAVAVACVPTFFAGQALERWEGALIVAAYGLYMTFLILTAAGSEALHGFAAAMWLVVPLLAITLAVLGVRRLRRGSPPSAT